MTPCIGLRDLFYSDKPADKDAAAAICETCPLKQACYDRAVATEATWCTYGGAWFGPKSRNWKKTMKEARPMLTCKVCTATFQTVGRTGGNRQHCSAECSQVSVRRSNAERKKRLKTKRKEAA